MRPIPPIAPAFVKQHEGGVLRVYDDAEPRRILKAGEAARGVLTAGYGHTGPDLAAGRTVTQADADHWLALDLETAAQRLRLRIGAVVDELTDHQYAALLSFVFNLGADPDWRIWTRLRARQFDQVPLEMGRFVKAGGVKLQGLVNRRAAEVALFTTAEPGIDAATPPSSVTRLMDTAPVASDPVPARKSATIWAAIASPFVGVFAMFRDAVLHLLGVVTPDQVNQVSGAIAPYVERSHLVASAWSGLAVLAAALTAILVLRKHNEAR